MRNLISAYPSVNWTTHSERHDLLPWYSRPRYHFDSLAHDNEARSSKVKSIVTLANERRDGTPSSIVLKGEQYVPKFNKTALDRVEILMAVFRVEDKATDVVVTFNVPLEAADGGSVSGSELPKFESDFEAFIKSFRIVDFGLFA